MGEGPFVPAVRGRRKCVVDDAGGKYPSWSVLAPENCSQIMPGCYLYRFLVDGEWKNAAGFNRRKMPL